MIGVPVAERAPLTSRTFEAWWLPGNCAALAEAPGSFDAGRLEAALSSRTRPFGSFTGTSAPAEALRAVVVDVSGSLRWRRSS